MPPWWTPLALLAVMFLGEVRTWRDFRERAAPSRQDASSLRLNNAMGWTALGAGLGSGLALRGVAALALPARLAWAGVAVSLAGTALRAWALSTLGRCFSLTIQVRPGQPVIQHGPYRLVRHPSYLGGDVAMLGIGLSAGNWVSPLAWVIPWLVAHVYRIRIEERALLDTLGEPYRSYQRRTWRLIPFVW